MTVDSLILYALVLVVVVAAIIVMWIKISKESQTLLIPVIAVDPVK